MKQPMKDYTTNEKFDNLYTPSYAVEPLLKYVPKNFVVWECTDSGNSNITKALKENGNIVISSDIATGFDFLNEKPTFDFDIIITNPPYTQKNEFLKRCYEYNKPFALLLPITALEGVERNKMFNEYGIELMVLDKRIDFTGKKSCWFNTSWFCKNILKEKLIFESIERR